jgi:hypothetical protein
LVTIILAYETPAPFSSIPSIPSIPPSYTPSQKPQTGRWTYSVYN